MKAILLLFVALIATSLAAFDAAECGFSPEATGKANTVALQRAFDRGGTITVARPGRYKIADTVFIGDDTTLICGAGVVFVKSNEGRRFAQVILNKGALSKTWNRNIEITGLNISVNGVDNNDWKVFGLRGHLAFFYAKDVRINRFRCLDLGQEQYSIHFCTFEDVVVDDVRIIGKKDGVHFGRGRRFTVRNGVFDTGDDSIALNAHDYSSGNPELGWIEDGVIENCHDLYNSEKHVGYFCRILAGAWCDWKAGMTVQQGDSVVSEGALYRVSMPVDGKTYVSKTRPVHKKGQVRLDGINWVWVQDEPVYECGVRNVVFRDIFLHYPRTAFSVCFEVGKYARSYYPGAKPPQQEGIVFDNVQVLYTNKVTFLKISTPVDSLSMNNCTLREGGVKFTTNKAMDDYGPTKMQMNGCRFYAKGKWYLVDNAIANKCVELVTTGSMTYDPAFSATVSTTGTIKVTSDLPGLNAHAAGLAAWPAASAQLKTEPVWDLAKDAGPISAQLKAQGCVPLSAATQFEIPCAAIQDFAMFTVRAKLRFDEMEERTQMRLFDQMTSDAGWSFSIVNFSRVGSPMTLNVNGAEYNTGWFHGKAGETHTFTIAAKKGMVVAYMDDSVLKRCFTVVTPASTPIKVGGGGSARMPEMKGVKLLELKIYGSRGEFWAKGEPHEFAVGYKGGKGWMVAVPAKEPKDLPRLLCYGDSISHGYSKPLKKLLENKAYLYHWSNFVSGFSINEKAFNDVATLARYDMIVFNNGLHSVHWTPEKATDEQIEGVTRAMVRAFRKGAPQAKLVWLSTTPHTAKKGTDGKVSATGDLDPIVQRINRIAAKVMKDEGVDVIDGYGLLIRHLDLATGDQYHWMSPAYEILAKAIAEKFRAVTRR